MSTTQRTEYEQLADEIEDLADRIHDKADLAQLAGATRDEVIQLHGSAEVLDRAVARLIEAILPRGGNRMDDA
jgi:hypothetical protein